MKKKRALNFGHIFSIVFKTLRIVFYHIEKLRYQRNSIILLSTYLSIDTTLGFIIWEYWSRRHIHVLTLSLFRRPLLMTRSSRVMRKLNMKDKKPKPLQKSAKVNSKISQIESLNLTFQQQISIKCLQFS